MTANRARLATRVLRSNFHRLDSPYKVNFIATWRCDSRCRICRIWEKDPGNELSAEEIRRIFINLPGLSWVDVSGGEIFLRDDIVELFAAILDSCPRLTMLHFPTSGSQPEKIVERTREILGMGPPKLTITVSLDGPPDLHDHQRGRTGAFDAALETYLRLKRLPRCDVYLGMTLSPANRGQFHATVKAVKTAAPRITANDIHVNLMTLSDHYYGNLSGSEKPCGGELDEIARILKMRPAGRSPYQLFERRYLQLAGDYMATGRSPVPCQALSATCFIDPEGTVYPCSSWNRPMGNLREHRYDLAQIWNAPETRAAREEIAQEKCPGCWTPCEAFPALGGNLRHLFGLRNGGKPVCTL